MPAGRNLATPLGCGRPCAALFTAGGFENGCEGSTPQRAGIPDVRLHDLRHSFASFGVSLGLSLPMVGELLGHADAATTQRYAHLHNDPVRDAVEHIGAAIAAAMGGEHEL